jgi:hypothetical protein
MPSSDINQVAGQLLYTHPYVYFNTAQDAASKYPNLQSVFAKNFVMEGGTHNAAFSSVGGVQFQSLAKNAAWDQDL